MAARWVSPLRRSVSSAAESMSYTERMKAKGRPVSPHVTRYAFPIVAISSITQRVTGVLLTVGLGGVAGVSLAGGDVGGIASALGASSVAPAAKFAVAFPLTYHFCGALRHAVWDKMPETLENTKAAQSSWAVIAASGAASLGLAALSFSKQQQPPTGDD